MPAFAYTARDGSGATLRGRLDAPDRGGAAQLLRARGLLLLDLRAESTGAGISFDPRRWLPILSGDVEQGMRQLAVMYRAGLTVTEALDALASEAGARVGRLWRAVAQRVREGGTLTEALERQRAVPDLVVHLVRVGETTGELDRVLERGAEALERRRRLRAAVVAAMFYPAIVTVAALGVAAVMVLYLVPKLLPLLANFGRKLPWSTQLLADLSTWLTVNGVSLLAGLAVAGAALALVYSTPRGRLLLDRALLRSPIIGPTLRLGGSVLLCRALGALVSSGVSMLEALSAVERLMSNRDQQATLALARARVSAGEPVSPALRAGGAFTALVPQLVATGERSGSLDLVLAHLAEFHEEQLQRRIRWLGMIVEPVMIVVVGGIVGFVYFAFFQAVYGAIGGVR